MFKLPKTPSLILCIVVLCLEALPTGCSQAPSRTNADYLRCEYRVDPVGIGVTTPRLSWIVTAPPGARGVKQTAYRILISSSPDKLANDQGDFWDSGKVNSNASAQITYSGMPLAARAQCWWKVKLWDENNREGDWSQSANFSVGLLTATDWQARWIGFDAPSDSSLSPEVETRLLNQKWAVAPPAVDSKSPHTAIFQRAFNLPAGAKLAKLAFHLGPDQICTVSVNGTVVGTAYRWLPAEEIDATQAVRPGKNIAQLAITQEDGYSPAVDGEMMLQIDGKPAQYLPIDSSWQVSWSSAEKAEQGAAAPKSQPANLVDHTPWGTPVSSFHRLTPASYLRKDFTVEKTVRRATVYSTALGVYEFHLNGHKVGEDVLTPGWTQFPRRVYYQAYDVTPLVHPGENTAGIILGDGWFASALSFTGKRNFYGGPPRTKAQLEIEYTDGTRQVIATDESWTASTGPLRYSDIWLGCAYDATRELAGWDDPNPTGIWKPVAVGLASTSSAPAIDEAKMKVEATPSDSARVLEHLPTQTVTEPQPHVYVFDLGQNIVGWAHLHLAGKAGQRLTVRYGEMLNPDGMVYTSNLRGAMATDVFTLKDGDQSLEPIFTFHGFRYVEVLGLDANPGPGAVEGEVVHSVMPEAGDFTCSNPRVNQLVRNIQRGQKGNYLYIPTDCPQRDERLGWTGDTQFFIRTGTYNFDTAGFFTNWLVTMCEDSQSENGAFADVAPDALGASGATAWGDAALTCTYTIYRVYGDTRVIDDHWAALKRYMNFLASKTDDRGISTVGGFGDWLNKGGGASAPVIDTAYHVYLAGIMAEMARATGRGEEAAAFQNLCMISCGMTSFRHSCNRTVPSRTAARLAMLSRSRWTSCRTICAPKWPISSSTISRTGDGTWPRASSARRGSCPPFTSPAATTSLTASCCRIPTHPGCFR
jgi:alpha-L-rhamnosidase